MGPWRFSGQKFQPWCLPIDKLERKMFSVFKEELVHSSVCTSEPILRSF